MRFKFLFLAGLIIVSACGKKGPSFEEIACDPDASSQNANIKRIFKPCREFIYSAKYYGPEYDLISDEKIWMMATGRDWDQQPEYQSELVIQYDFDESKIGYIDQFNINPEKATDWVRKETTGIIENSAEVWMHPFRSNQYAFTEVSAFPNVKYPLQKGEGWFSDISIYEGWGRWSNTEAKSLYNIIDLEVVSTEFGSLNAWHIKTRTMTDFGRTTASFWFNEEYGFVKMVVTNYAGQLLDIELIAVNE